MKRHILRKTRDADEKRWDRFGYFLQEGWSITEPDMLGWGMIVGQFNNHGLI